MRVNVETRAFAEQRFDRLRNLLNYSKKEAIGLLVILWHDSQEAMKIEAERQEILEWLDDPDAEKVFDALLKCRYISEGKNGLFEIHGNLKHVTNHEVRKQKARIAGVESGKSRKSKKLELRVQSAEHNTIQYNSIQSNSLHSNSIQNKTEEEENTITSEVEKSPTSRGCVDSLKIYGLILENRLSNVSHKVQEAWLETFPSAEWVANEIKKAHTWILSNPQKAPKKFDRFMSNWLNRSFENYRKGLPSRIMTTSEKNAISLKDMYDRVSKGEL